MAGTDMGGFLELLGNELQPLEVEELKYIWGNSFKGTFSSFIALQETFFEIFNLLNHCKYIYL